MPKTPNPCPGWELFSRLRDRGTIPTDFFILSYSNVSSFYRGMNELALTRRGKSGLGSGNLNFDHVLNRLQVGSLLRLISSLYASPVMGLMVVSLSLSFPPAE
jgi:hypothetical protein